MSFHASAEAALWAMALAVVTAAVGYVVNGHQKRAEMRGALAGEARLKAYGSLQTAFHRYLTLMRCYRLVRRSEDRERSFMDRFGDLTVVAGYGLQDVRIEEDLFRAADDKDEARLDRLRRSMFIRCDHELRAAQARFQEAVWTCRLVVFDADLRARLDAFEAAAWDCKIKMRDKDDEAFEAARRHTERLQSELVDHLATNIAVEFGGR